MRKIKSFKIFENSDWLLGEIEDIVIHFCEDENIDFKLSLNCVDDVIIYKLSDSITHTSSNWDRYDKKLSSHKAMSKELGLNFFHVDDCLVFSKYNKLVDTGIEVLDYLKDKLEVKEITHFGRNNEYKYYFGDLLVFSYEKSKLKKYDPKTKKVSSMTEKIYLDYVIYILFDKLSSERRIDIVRSWVSEYFDEGFKDFERVSVYSKK